MIHPGLRAGAFLLCLVVVVALVVVLLRPTGSVTAPQPTQEGAPSQGVPPPATATKIPPRVGDEFSPDRPALAPLPPSPDFPRPPLADALNAPETSPRDDLRLVAHVLTLYAQRFGALPAFETNAQLVNALTGANPARIPFLPPDHPAIEPSTGSLVDRWGTPYFFHAIARNHIEIRSAGPDREMFTPDDLLQSNQGAHGGPAE